MIQAKGEGADEHGYIVTEKLMRILNWFGTGKLQMVETAVYSTMWLKIRNSPSPPTLQDLNISL